MIVLFPSHPLRPKEPEPSFASEYGAAKKAGFKVGFIDTEIILGGEVKLRLPDDRRDHEPAIYRGWLLKPDHYRAMYASLDAMTYRLVSTPEDYLASYMLPTWYRLLDPEERGERTPRSIVLPAEEYGAKPPEYHYDLEAVVSRVRQAFGANACIVKDYLKTQKHRWFEACFIPDASDSAAVTSVVSTFLQLTGPDLVGGLVFREFEEFQRIGIHPKLRSPILNEWRAYMRKGKVVHLCPYWADGEYEGVEQPSIALMETMAAPLAHLPVIAVDFAKREDWRVVEVNAFECAGIPRDGGVGDFYRALRKEFTE